MIHYFKCMMNYSLDKRSSRRPRRSSRSRTVVEKLYRPHTFVEMFRRWFIQALLRSRSSSSSSSSSYTVSRSRSRRRRGRGGQGVKVREVKAGNNFENFENFENF